MKSPKQMKQLVKFTMSMCDLIAEFTENEKTRGDNSEAAADMMIGQSVDLLILLFGPEQARDKALELFNHHLVAGKKRVEQLKVTFGLD